MTRRRLLFGLLLLSVVVSGFAGWLWMASRPRVTRARFERVKVGMSLDEVVRTVGGLPGDYGNWYVYTDGVRPPPFVRRPSPYQEWLCDDGCLLVHFDNADMATDVDVSEVPRYVLRPLTRTERIRRWLGL
jgi:hypothetical protein